MISRLLKSLRFKETYCNFVTFNRIVDTKLVVSNGAKSNNVIIQMKTFIITLMVAFLLRPFLK